MVDFDAIQKVCDQIVREFHPLKVILFGSYAYGTPTEDSDVDLLVVMPTLEDHPAYKAAEILHKIRPLRSGMAIDLLVRTPDILRQRIAWNDFFLKEITERGKVLYESADERVG